LAIKIGVLVPPGRLMAAAYSMPANSGGPETLAVIVESPTGTAALGMVAVAAQ
jgi:hypothetical protein